MTDRLDKMEETLAHMARTLEDLSEVAARQAREIDLLTRRVALLMEREAEREAAGGGGIPLADQKQPHW